MLALHHLHKIWRKKKIEKEKRLGIQSDIAQKARYVVVGATVSAEELTSSHCQHVTKCTAGLHVTTVGVDVNVPNWLLDANADTQSLSSVRVQNIHKVGVIWGEAPLLLHTLKHRPCRVQTYQIL